MDDDWVHAVSGEEAARRERGGGPCGGPFIVTETRVEAGTKVVWILRKSCRLRCLAPRRSSSTLRARPERRASRAMLLPTDWLRKISEHLHYLISNTLLYNVRIAHGSTDVSNLILSKHQVTTERTSYSLARPHKRGRRVQWCGQVASSNFNHLNHQSQVSTPIHPGSYNTHR